MGLDSEARDAMRQALPRLSWAAFIGDLPAVLYCLRQGDDVHQSVRLINQNGQDVLGASPLYLAAQMGHYDVCKALLKAGADVLRPCVVPATGQCFKPPEIALMHFHVRTWWLLKEAKQKAKGTGASRRLKAVGRSLLEKLDGLKIEKGKLDKMKVWKLGGQKQKQKQQQPRGHPHQHEDDLDGDVNFYDAYDSYDVYDSYDDVIMDEKLLRADSVPSAVLVVPPSAAPSKYGVPPAVAHSKYNLL